MLCLPEKRAVVLKLRNPEKVTAVIPTAKVLNLDGSTYVAVPHRFDETRVLNNLGIKAPSPIRYHYSWSGRYVPFHAQLVTAEMLSLNSRAFVLNQLGCVDADTEYLSPTGWKRIADYTGGDVAQYHPETGAIEFVAPTKFVKLPCPEMVRIKTKYGIDQLLSPEHRVLLHSSSNTEKREVLHAEELLRRHDAYAAGARGKMPKRSMIGYQQAQIPAAFNTSGGAGIACDDAQLRLMVAVIADGNFPNGSNRCIVRVKKDRKKLRLRQLLTAAQVAFTERARDTATASGYSVFSFLAPWKTKEFGAEFWAATSAQLAVLADEIPHWDANVPENANRAIRFSSYIKASADFAQYVFSSQGMVARLTESRRERRGLVEVEYTVLARRDGAKALGLHGTHPDGSMVKAMWREPSTDGFKYCFMVPSTFLLFRRNGCVFASGNTGKTLAVLWGYDYLRKIGKVHKAIVVCPLSTLERTWADELFEHFPHLNFAVLHGTAAKRRKLLAQDDIDVYLINHDGVKIVVDDLAKRPDIDLVVVDEISQAARNAQTDRWKALNAIINKQGITRWAWGMTGTPTPNSPTDAWAQCRLLVPSRVVPYFKRFQDQVMRQVSTYRWVPRDDALAVVQEAMQPAVCFKRSDCLDLPPCLVQTRHAALTDDQQRAYTSMVNTLRVEAAQGDVIAVNQAVKLAKLVQIACGVAYSATGEEVCIPAQSRLDVVTEIIEEAAAKVIVFVPFVSAVNYVAEHIRALGRTVGVIHGGVSKHQRDAIFSGFQHGTEYDIIVAQPAAMSHGLTLTAADTIVWYAPVTSNDIYEQASGRITRPGQTRNTLIVNIEGTPVERKLYARLRDKQAMQGSLLDMIAEDTC